MTNIIVGYIIVFFIVFSLFGLTVVISNKLANKVLKRYLLHLFSLLLFLLIYTLSKSTVTVLNLNLRDILSWSNFVLACLAIFPTAIIMYCSDKTRPNRRFSTLDFLDGVAMEIVQRLLAQSLFVLVLIKLDITKYIETSIILNGLLWVNFILLQELMNKKKLSLKVAFDAVSSFWFSIFIGVLFYKTGNIAIPMICHGLERYFKHYLRIKFGVLKE